MTVRHRGPIFPLLLAVVWVVFTALALGDFADFSANTHGAPAVQAVAQQPGRSVGRSGRTARVLERSDGGPTRPHASARSLADLDG